MYSQQQDSTNGTKKRKLDESSSTNPLDGEGSSITAPTPPSEISLSTYGSLNLEQQSSIPSKSSSSSDATHTQQRQLWMSKLPTRLMNAWEDVPEGTILGTLSFTKGGIVTPPKVNANPKKPPIKSNVRAVKQPPSKSILRVMVSTDIATAHPDLPTRYTVEAMTKQVPVLHPFTRHGDASDQQRNEPPSKTPQSQSQDDGEYVPPHPPGRVDIHGVISRSCILQIDTTPSANTDGNSTISAEEADMAQRYKNLCKHRLIESHQHDRYVKPVESSELGGANAVNDAHTAGAGTGTSDSGFGESIKRHGQSILDALERSGHQTNLEALKKRFENQSMKSIVFSLFSGRRYWSVKDLRQCCGRTDKEIRDVLGDLGSFIKSGEHKGQWELREEFRMGENSGTSVLGEDVGKSA